MPEILEVELARRALVPLVGSRVVAVEASDPLVVGPGVDDVIRGARLVDVARRGKQLVLDTSHGPVGVHFGMTGRWLIDGVSPLGELAYGSRSDATGWDRWALRLRQAKTSVNLRLHDPRRLARVVLDPDVERLGPDALGLTKGELRDALAGRRTALKAVLLDQTAVAGLGNLLVDEVLWWSGLSPLRIARELDDAEVARLHTQIRRRLPVMLRRGGSHRGELSPVVRAALGVCPRDGRPLARTAVGGRTTVWCPAHQH
jgi:formamidopyrimidine-DNA glycosylase